MQRLKLGGIGQVGEPEGQEEVVAACKESRLAICHKIGTSRSYKASYRRSRERLCTEAGRPRALLGLVGSINLLSRRTGEAPHCTHAAASMKTAAHARRPPRASGTHCGLHKRCTLQRLKSQQISE